MKFAIAVNMERREPREDMREVAKRALTLVQIAEQGANLTREAPVARTVKRLCRQCCEGPRIGA